MKIVDKNRNKKDKVKKKGRINKPQPKKARVLVVAQEIKFARKLSGFDKKTRDRVIKALQKWITNCCESGYEFKEEDVTRIWKGLFYAVWMSDKPLVQEELCESIAALLDLFPPERLQQALLMTRVGLKMLATEWFGLDHHRMDKFLMCVRRYLRGSLRVLQRCSWSQPACQLYGDMLTAPDGLLAVNTPHYARNASSMILHFMDCFLEELAKVSGGDIPPASVAALLQPFVVATCLSTSEHVSTAARRVLAALIRQSEHGIVYADRTRAWRQMGCPAGGPEALEPASDDDDEHEVNGDDAGDSEGALDPRAGRVDVTLPLLPVPARMLANMLADKLAQVGSRAQRRVRIYIQRFEKLAEGEHPFPVCVPEVEEEADIRPARAARALALLEHKLRGDADELKLRGLSRKHRKRLLKKTRAGLSIVEDVQHHNTLSQDSNNGEWLVESTDTKETEKDTSNKENQEKTKNGKNKGQKRKNDTQHRDTNDKKQKLNKNNVNNKVNNIISNGIKKKNLEKSSSIKEKKIPIKTDEIKTKQDTKEDTKLAKVTKTTTDIKVKKTKNRPQILTHKNDKQTDTVKKSIEKSSQQTNVVKVRESPKAKGENKFIKKEKTTVLASKVKNFQKPIKDKKDSPNKFETPKKVKFVLKNNSMQKPVDYYISVKKSPNIPFDSSKQPSKTNLKPSTPSPINPFFKKKLRLKN